MAIAVITAGILSFAACSSNSPQLPVTGSRSQFSDNSRLQTLVYVTDQDSVSVYGDGPQRVARMYGPKIAPWGLALDRNDLVYSVQIGDYGHGKPGSLAIFPTTNGHVNPKAFIRCHIKKGWSAAVDRQGNVHVTDPASGAVVTFAPNASGCARPLSVLKGSRTGLGAATGMAIDSRGQVIVTSGPGDSVSVHGPGAFGDAAPIALITGARTGLNEPEGAAVDAQDNIWVSNYNGSTITEYASKSNGDVTPLRTIAGPDTHLSSPIGIAVSQRTGIVYVAELDGVLAFPANANGNVAPMRVITGASVAVAVGN